MTYGEQYRGPFFGIERAAAQVLAREFKGAQQLRLSGLYMRLAELRNDHRDDGDPHTFVKSRAEIARLMKISLDTLDRGVAELERVGLVEVERRRKGKLHQPNRWTLLFPDESSRTAAATRTDAASSSRTAAAQLPQEDIGHKNSTRRVFDPVSQRLRLVQEREHVASVGDVDGDVGGVNGAGVAASAATAVRAHGQPISEASG